MLMLMQMQMHLMLKATVMTGEPNAASQLTMNSAADIPDDR